jgi:hypothetical protein
MACGLPILLMHITPNLVVDVGTQGGLKETPHVEHYAFIIPVGGRYPPMISYMQKCGELAKHFLSVPKNKDIIHYETLLKRIKLGEDDPLSIRCFFLIIFIHFLFPTTKGICTIRRDVEWTSHNKKYPIH